eukprot:COSAG06_NODE_38172_length_426_cov_1.125382_2_plen_33_part_01
MRPSSGPAKRRRPAERPSRAADPDMVEQWELCQ